MIGMCFMKLKEAIRDEEIRGKLLKMENVGQNHMYSEHFSHMPIRYFLKPLHNLTNS